ncbi:hypothetical protein [uncultured Bradyrhizobium sp.]|uniref:hypothetical protein n=1 Tax=uncultured Bradyrhizobium sp. TaxID=199684 RepID=UPI002622A018|nr:hypothetical protein [uncultured Bradyrhizobium sp.]
MIDSMRSFDSDSTVWILCLSSICHQALQELRKPNVRLINLEILEKATPGLSAARANRSQVEYYFTCTPSLMEFTLAQADDGDVVTYVDGDLFFFDDPRVLLQEMGDNSVAIIPHNFLKPSLQRFGLFNVGWVSFRNDTIGRAVSRWWQARCIEWCFDMVESDRYADQKYLDSFSQLTNRLTIIRHPGANLAPWNIRQDELSKKDGKVYVRGAPLIFFHFHALKIHFDALFLAKHVPYGSSYTKFIREEIYRPYAKTLREFNHLVASKIPTNSPHLRGLGSRRSSLKLTAVRLKQLVEQCIALGKGHWLIEPKLPFLKANQ